MYFVDWIVVSRVGTRAYMNASTLSLRDMLARRTHRILQPNTVRPSMKPVA
jgi:hypothetical protein